jgi:hypothetical protein
MTRFELVQIIFGTFYALAFAAFLGSVASVALSGNW